MIKRMTLRAVICLGALCTSGLADEPLPPIQCPDVRPLPHVERAGQAPRHRRRPRVPPVPRRLRLRPRPTLPPRARERGEPVRGLLDYDDEAVAQILSYSGRKPHAIQRLCSAAVRQALTAERTRVTAEDVQQAHRLLTEEDTARAAGEGKPAVYAVRSPVEQLAEDREDYQPESPQDDG